MSDSIVAWKPRTARHDAAVTPAASGSAIACEERAAGVLRVRDEAL